MILRTSPEQGLPRQAFLTGPRPALDPRRAIARPDLVDIALAAQVAAARYVEPVSQRCRVPRTPMRLDRGSDARPVSELLFGEDFDLFDCDGDWGFGRSVADGYSGWVAIAALGDPGPDLRPGPATSITARRAPVFAAPDIKTRVLMELPFGARLAGTAEERFFALAGGGFVHLAHIAALPADPVAIARRCLGAPYLWGGRSPDGVDCSGLVQLALAAAGTPAPRDSDQQLAELGTAVAFAHRVPGDLIFFPGHVGFLTAGDCLLHANAHWMAVVEEPLADVIARLVTAGVGEPVTGVRRIQGRTRQPESAAPHPITSA